MSNSVIVDYNTHLICKIHKQNSWTPIVLLFQHRPNNIAFYIYGMPLMIETGYV